MWDQKIWTADERRAWIINSIRRHFAERHNWWFNCGNFRTMMVHAWAETGRMDKAKASNERRIQWIMRGWPSNAGVA
jgi:hypothetical protein